MKTPRWTGSTTPRECNHGGFITCHPVRFGPERQEASPARGRVPAVVFVDRYLERFKA